MSPWDQVRELAEGGEVFSLPDGFEDALVGVTQTFERGGVRYRTLYSLQRMIEICVNRDGMSEQEAEEFIEFNVLGAYVGDSTPGFLLDLGIDRGV